MSFLFAKTILDYADHLKPLIPHDVISKYITPFYLYRGNYILSRHYKQQDDGSIISRDEMNWLAREVEIRRAAGDFNLYDYQIIQGPIIAPDRNEIEFHYKRIRGSTVHYMTFNYCMNHAELDAMYQAVLEQTK